MGVEQRRINGGSDLRVRVSVLQGMERRKSKRRWVLWRNSYGLVHCDSSASMMVLVETG